MCCKARVGISVVYVGIRVVYAARPGLVLALCVLQGLVLAVCMLVLELCMLQGQGWY